MGHFASCFRMRQTMIVWLTGFPTHLHYCFYFNELWKLPVHLLGNLLSLPHFLEGWPKYGDPVFFIIIMVFRKLQLKDELVILRHFDINLSKHEFPGVSIVSFFCQPFYRWTWWSATGWGQVSSFTFQGAADCLCWENLRNHSR